MCTVGAVDDEEDVPVDKWLSILHNRKGKRNGEGKKRQGRDKNERNGKFYRQ
jgi:hypothetical protein